MAESSNYRLVTRPDLDGIVCGALLEERGMIDDVLFVHPIQIQHETVEIGSRDILANLPHHRDAHLIFDHHSSEIERVGNVDDGHVIDADAPSAARVVYDHLGGSEGLPEIDPTMIDAVDNADSAAFSMEDILTPTGWLLLHFIVDPRTGLDGFKSFSVERDTMLKALITYCRHTPIDEILAHPDVVERIDAYTYYNEFAELQIVRCSELKDRVVITDYRAEEKIYPVNRFMVYGIFPESRVSMSLRPGLEAGRTEIAVGRSILDRSSEINLGSLMLRYGGGGHAAAATCQIANDAVADTVAEVVAELNES